MLANIQSVLEEVAKKIVPLQHEQEQMARLAERLKNQVREVLASSGFGGTVSVQGSYARDTWLSGEADLDIFVAFPPSMNRSDWTDKILPTIKNAINAKVIDRYAEHPFLEFHLDGVRVNVVPCYSVEKGQWKSATDRTPFHTEYMQRHLTAEMRLEARLLKRFLKGIRSYGAEIRVGGFSGMLVDTLILYYRTFLRTLENVSKWTPIIFLDLENPRIDQDSKAREFGSSLVVVDPVDPDRNLAAAVRQDKLWSFVAASRELLENPGIWYFFPPKPRPRTKGIFNKLIEHQGRDIVAISLRHSRVVPDVLWGQLLKIEKGIVELLARQDFHPVRSSVWSDEVKSSGILVELEASTISAIDTRQGPPVAKRDDSRGFLDRHLDSKKTVRGPWIEGDRWTVDSRREIRDVERLVAVALKDGRYGLPIPEQLREATRGNIRVLVNRKILSLLGGEGFDQVLSDFLMARPDWLRPHH